MELIISNAENWEDDSMYLFSYRSDKPDWTTGERRERPKLDTERKAASSTDHSFVQSHIVETQLETQTHTSIN